MRVPPRYVVVIEGTVHRVNRRDQIARGLAHLLVALFSGQEVPESALAAYGLRVMVEVDRDQADDEIDVLIDS